MRELQSVVSAIDVNLWSGEKTPLSISAGTAVFPDDGDSLERLFAVADSRMYERKFGRHASGFQN
jgi:GGDEF domain-containing protein